MERSREALAASIVLGLSLVAYLFLFVFFLGVTLGLVDPYSLGIFSLAMVYHPITLVITLLLCFSFLEVHKLTNKPSGRWTFRIVLFIVSGFVLTLLLNIGAQS